MNAKVKITYSCSECIKKHSDNWCPTESIGDIGSLSFQSPPGKKKSTSKTFKKMCVKVLYLSSSALGFTLAVLLSARREQYNYQSLRACTGRLCVCAGCEGTCVCAGCV